MKDVIPFTAAFNDCERHGSGLVWTVTVLENPEASTRVYIDLGDDLAQILRDNIIGAEIAPMIAKTA